MKHTLSVLVKNRAGAVAEATDVFRRRGISFRSISCAETEDFDVSRLVLTVEDHEAELESIADELRAQETMTVEMTGDTQKVDGFIRMLRPFGIRSLARTGVVAMKRGDDD